MLCSQPQETHRTKLQEKFTLPLEVDLIAAEILVRELGESCALQKSLHCAFSGTKASAWRRRLNSGVGTFSWKLDWETPHTHPRALGSQARQEHRKMLSVCYVTPAHSSTEN